MDIEEVKTPEVEDPEDILTSQVLVNLRDGYQDLLPWSSCIYSAGYFGTRICR